MTYRRPSLIAWLWIVVALAAYMIQFRSILAQVFRLA